MSLVFLFFDQHDKKRNELKMKKFLDKGLANLGTRAGAQLQLFGKGTPAALQLARDRR